MTAAATHAFAEACAKLVGQVSANPLVAESIVTALVAGELKTTTGPVGLSNVLKGAPGSHNLKEFLETWSTVAPHLRPLDVATMVESALLCYRIAQDRGHVVDAVWTGPEVLGSEVRRTEAVVKEILAGAQSEALVVGYWLVTNTAQIDALIGLLIQKARAGTKIRFVLDPSEKSSGPDNFAALNKLWPPSLTGSSREVYSWSDHMSKATSSSGHQYSRKLHAKVIVADRHDALVTSANLTHAGLLENLEMGLRVKGAMAGALTRHFDLLIGQGILKRQT